MAAIEFVAGDTGSKLIVTCKTNQDSVVIDLTGASLKLNFKIDSGTLKTPAMTITNLPGTDGKAEYQFISTDLVAGDMQAAAEITDSVGKIITQLVPFKFKVRAKLA